MFLYGLFLFQIAIAVVFAVLLFKFYIPQINTWVNEYKLKYNKFPIFSTALWLMLGFAVSVVCSYRYELLPQQRSRTPIFEPLHRKPHFNKVEAVPFGEKVEEALEENEKSRKQKTKEFEDLK